MSFKDLSTSDKITLVKANDFSKPYDKLGNNSSLTLLDGSKTTIFKAKDKSRGLAKKSKELYDAIFNFLPPDAKRNVENIRSGGKLFTTEQENVQMGEEDKDADPTDEDLMKLADTPNVVDVKAEKTVKESEDDRKVKVTKAVEEMETQSEEEQFNTAIQDDRKAKVQDILNTMTRAELEAKVKEMETTQRIADEEGESMEKTQPPGVSFDRPKSETLIKEEIKQDSPPTEENQETEDDAKPEVISEEAAVEIREENLVVIDNKLIELPGLEESAQNEQALVNYTEDLVKQREQFVAEQETKPKTERLPVPPELVNAEENQALHEKHLQETLQYDVLSPSEVEEGENATAPLQLIGQDGNIVAQISETEVDQAVGATPEVATDVGKRDSSLPATDDGTSTPDSIDTSEATPQALYTGSGRVNKLTPYVALHVDAIGIFFGSSTQPEFDDSLLRDRIQRFDGVPLEDLRAPFLQQNISLFNMYGPKLLIYELKAGQDSPIEMVAKENFELLQLYNGLKKFKGRIPIAGIPLSQLLNLGNAVNDSKAPIVDAPKDFDPASVGSGRLGPVSDLEAVIVGSVKQQTLAQRMILQGYTPAADNPRQLYNKARKKLAPNVTARKYYNPLAGKQGGFNQTNSKATKYLSYSLNKDKFQEKRSDKVNWAGKLK